MGPKKQQEPTRGRSGSMDEMDPEALAEALKLKGTDHEHDRSDGQDSPPLLDEVSDDDTGGRTTPVDQEVDDDGGAKLADSITNGNTGDTGKAAPPPLTPKPPVYQQLTDGAYSAFTTLVNVVIKHSPNKAIEDGSAKLAGTDVDGGPPRTPDHNNNDDGGIDTVTGTPIKSTNIPGGSPLKITEHGETVRIELKDLLTPQVKFAGSAALSKVLVAPAIKYTTAQMKGGDDSSLVEYYQASVPAAITGIAKYTVFSLISFVNPMPKACGLANTIMANKITADAIYNTVTEVTNVALYGAKLNLDSLYKMTSMDYAKELTWFVIPSLHSMVGGNHIIDINKVLESAPVAAGMVMGAGSELIDLVGTTGTKAYDMAHSMVFSHDEDTGA